MACDLASDLSQQVALVLPPLILPADYSYSTSSIDPSIVLDEGKEQSNSGASLDPATSQVSFIATIIIILCA